MTKQSSKKVPFDWTHPGISYLKLRLKEYNDSDKSTEMPEYLPVSVARFAFSSDQQANFVEELKFWTEHNAVAFKNTLNQPLSLISNPNSQFAIDMTASPSLDIQDLDIAPKLKDLMFELGPVVTADEQNMARILAEVQRLTDRDVMETINMMIENTPFVEADSGNSDLSRLSKHVLLETLKNHRMDTPDSVVPAANFDAKSSGTWNYLTFIKAVSETKKTNWTAVLRQMDNPEFQMSSKRSFQEFLQIYEIIKETQKVTFPRELMVGKWDNLRSQLSFLHRFIEHGKTEISLYKDLKNKNLVDYDTSPSVRNTSVFINSGMEIWLFKDFVVRLIELSES